MSAVSSQIEPNIRSLRILIADDHPIIRKHVRRILEEQPRFSVCGEAYDSAKATEEAQRLKPDVVVLNVSMPILNGMDCNIGPICHQPDFIRHILWAEDIHSDKPCGTVDKMRTENESSLDLGIHVIGHDKSAQDANRLLFQLSNSSRKNFLSESTPTDG
jgi:hypothetical protein